MPLKARIRSFFSPNYYEGWVAGLQGKSFMKNPYEGEASIDNLHRGIGASPWWDTEYWPFIEWQKEYFDAHDEIDKQQRINNAS